MSTVGFLPLGASDSERATVAVEPETQDRRTVAGPAADSNPSLKGRGRSATAGFAAVVAWRAILPRESMMSFEKP